MKKNHLKLSSEDISYLQDLLSKGSLKVRVQKRALALLELNKGKTYQAVHKTLEVTYATVLSWSKKYRSEGLAFLTDKSRSGRPIGISGEDRAKVTALACSQAPSGYSKWSLRLLADKAVELELVEDISHATVRNILKKTKFSPIEKNNGV